MSNSDYAKPMDDKWWSSILEVESEGQRDDVLVKIRTPIMNNQVEKSVRDSVQLKKATMTADQDVDWSLILRLQAEEEVLEASAVGFNRGGLLVETRYFKGFVPVSHLIELDIPDEKIARERFLKTYLGQDIQVKVIECDADRGRIVLSQRAAQAAPGQRQKLFSRLEEGHHLSGIVTNITDFGIFVDLGGIEGLVHISEISWGRVMRPRDFVQVGREIDVMVLQKDQKKDKISLSIKRLVENPWESVLERFPLGSEHEAKVTEVVKYGAFSRLQEGLEGLIHISEMNLNEFDQPGDILEEGEVIIVEILSVDPDKQRLSLRMK